MHKNVIFQHLVAATCSHVAAITQLLLHAFAVKSNNITALAAILAAVLACTA